MERGCRYATCTCSLLFIYMYLYVPYLYFISLLSLPFMSALFFFSVFSLWFINFIIFCNLSLLKRTWIYESSFHCFTDLSFSAKCFFTIVTKVIGLRSFLFLLSQMCVIYGRFFFSFSTEQSAWIMVRRIPTSILSLRWPSKSIDQIFVRVTSGATTVLVAPPR